MKIAVIAHTTQRGGAAISNTMNLKYLLDSGQITKEDTLLILPQGDLGMYKCLGLPFHQWTLPFSWIFRGAAPGIHRKIYRMGMELVSIIAFIIRYNRILINEKVQQVYLNSMVLWILLPFFPICMNTTIHIRESFDTSLESKIAVWAIRTYADKIIAINPSVAKPFNDLHNLTVIENPIDMYPARQFRNLREELKEKMGLEKDTFIISMFSPVGLQKGYNFLLKIAQLLSPNKKIIILSAGSVDKGSEDLLKQLLKYPNFKHISEQESTDKFYAITDVIIRCEDYLPLGRTVFEGIYAGCLALLPYSSEDDIEPFTYLDQIYLYPARNEYHCVAVLLGLYCSYPKGVPNNGFEPTSNVKESSEKLINTIKIRLGRRDE